MSTKDRMIDASKRDLVGALNPKVTRNRSLTPDLSNIIQNVENFEGGDMSYSEISKYLNDIHRDVAMRGTTDGEATYYNRYSFVKIAKEYVDEIILSTAGMITKSDYFKMLEQHDWFACFSDSHSVYLSGESARRGLEQLAKLNTEFAPMLSAYRKYVSEGVNQTVTVKPKLEDFI